MNEPKKKNRNPRSNIPDWVKQKRNDNEKKKRNPAIPELDGWEIVDEKDIPCGYFDDDDEDDDDDLEGYVIEVETKPSAKAKAKALEDEIAKQKAEAGERGGEYTFVLSERENKIVEELSKGVE